MALWMVVHVSPHLALHLQELPAGTREGLLRKLNQLMMSRVLSPKLVVARECASSACEFFIYFFNDDLF